MRPPSTRLVATLTCTDGHEGISPLNWSSGGKAATGCGGAMQLGAQASLLVPPAHQHLVDLVDALGADVQSRHEADECLVE